LFGATVNGLRPTYEPGASNVTYFFFRRFVVFFFATRFAFFFVFFFAAIGMSTTPLVLNDVRVCRLGPPKT
jgi:hypothetical protein